MTGVGCGLWKSANNLEFVGNIVFNIGMMGLDRGHGHCIYMQNTGENGNKLVKGNILFNSFAMGLNLYGSSNSKLTNFNVENNIIFNAGIMRGDDNLQKNISCYGGETVLDDIVFHQNMTYFNSGVYTGQNVMIGEFNVNQEVTFTENKIFGGYCGLDVNLWNEATITGNLVVSRGDDYLVQMSKPDNANYVWEDNSYY